MRIMIQHRFCVNFGHDEGPLLRESSRVAVRTIEKVTVIAGLSLSPIRNPLSHLVCYAGIKGTGRKTAVGIGHAKRRSRNREGLRAVESSDATLLGCLLRSLLCLSCLQRVFRLPSHFLQGLHSFLYVVACVPDEVLHRFSAAFEIFLTLFRGRAQGFLASLHQVIFRQRSIGPQFLARVFSSLRRHEKRSPATDEYPRYEGSK